MRVLLAVVFVTIASSGIFAQQIMVKEGDCPNGYFQSADKCVPTSNARPAYLRSGWDCPNTFMKSGAYCVADAAAQHVLPHNVTLSSWTRFKHEWLSLIFGTK